MPYSNIGNKVKAIFSPLLQSYGWNLIGKLANNSKMLYIKYIIKRYSLLLLLQIARNQKKYREIIQIIIINLISTELCVHPTVYRINWISGMSLQSWNIIFKFLFRYIHIAIIFNSAQGQLAPLDWTPIDNRAPANFSVFPTTFKTFEFETFKSINLVEWKLICRILIKDNIRINSN